MSHETPPVVTRKKLIEVALPLDAINKASAREKSIRRGHPSTLHLWWARRPLAAARAVIFAQMVDDPSANPDIFRGERAQERERKRLFSIIEELVRWENTTNEAVLQRARDEIWQSWRRACADNADHPCAKELFDRHVLPGFHDPFAGGGSLPLEAQRLGLEAHASDLNPVAVLINKAMIEIPTVFAGRPPVNSEARRERRLMDKGWRGAEGLAADVRYYGRWVRDEAAKRIGQLYPKVQVTKTMANGRPDVEPHVGRNLTVIAWLWVRTARSPNPAFAEVHVPLSSSFVLSNKTGNEAYVEPVIDGNSYRFVVKSGLPPKAARIGTKSGGSRSSFVCLMSGSPMPFEYLRSEGKAGRLGTRLMAVVADGKPGRVYLPVPPQHSTAAQHAEPKWIPPVAISHWPGRTNVVEYGLTTFGHLFTRRQLTALNTFSELITDVQERAEIDALASGLSKHDEPLRCGGTSAKAYGQAVAVYLAFAVDKGANYWSNICAWHTTRYGLVSTFGRQALPMVWDFAEANPLSQSSGNWMLGVDQAARMLEGLGTGSLGHALQTEATSQALSAYKIVSCDPPYYDNIGYSDLSDFFYVWLRRSLHHIYPELFSTMATPKAEELVASPYRHGGKEEAETFFLSGMTQAVRRLSEQAHAAFPVTIYYAFRQSENNPQDGNLGTAWEAFLEAMLKAGFAISGTWPLRTEYTGNLKKNMNSLASSIVLVCRPRHDNATVTTRREFQEALRAGLKQAVTQLQGGNIAPVDLAQALIGPGMAIYTRYSKVLNADGSPMSVRDALKLINGALDEALAEQEGDFDPDTRWALTWFEQHGFTKGEFGVAEQLSKAKNTSVDGLVRAGIIRSSHGSVRTLKPDELDPDWNPASDRRLTVWEMTHHLIRALTVSESEAAYLTAALGNTAQAARDLAYRLYTVSERKRRAADALQYNSLVQSWPEIERLAQQQPKPTQIAMPTQAEGGP